MKEAARAFPGRIVVGADAKGGKIATQGWAETYRTSRPSISASASRMPASPRSCSPTSTRDGLLRGVNVAATAALARAVTIPVIASGGVGGIGDIEALIAAGTQYRRRRDRPGAL